MRRLFIAAAVIAAVIAVVGVVGVGAVVASYAYVSSPSSVMLPDAMQTKAEILRRVPLGTFIQTAKEIITNNGFECGTMKNTRYADFANPLNKQVDRGPANILYCESGERSSGLIFITKRWQVLFEDVDGRVSSISAGVGLTGF